LSCRGLLAAAILCFALPPLVRADDLGEFLGRRVTRVEVLVDGEQATALLELRTLLDVAPSQDYSPVRIHDSLVRLYRSGLVSSARVEAAPEGAGGVILRFYVRPQARISNVVFEGRVLFDEAELRARLNQLDTGERVSAGAISRGLGELIAFYSARGYYQTKITSDIRLNPSKTNAVVVYNIEPGEQATLSKYAVEINGAKIEMPKPAKGKQVLVEGQAFAQSAVQDEMDRYRDAYLAKDYLAVKVTSTTTPDANSNTVAVKINVESGPRVQIDIEGLKISDKDKRKTLPFYTTGGLDEFALEEGARRLQEFAQRKGYFFAIVLPPPAPDPKQQEAKLLYKVEAAQRYKLSDIDIEGLDAIPSVTMQEQMKSKTANFLALGDARRGITSDDMLRQDSNLVMKRLRELGYRRSQVDVRRGVSLDGSKLIITFDVKQGPRAYVQEVALRGNSLLSSDELAPEVEIKKGEPLTSAAVTETADNLLSAYNSRGYATTEVVPTEIELGGADGQERVRLLYTVTEGNRARIHSVVTRGNAVTHTGRLVGNFYLFEEGDWLRSDRLQETERVLYETNAFNSVSISSEPVGNNNNIEERDITVNLMEAKRRDVIFGFGYQSNPSDLHIEGLDLKGARFLVQLTHTNLFGRLYTGSAQLRVGSTELFGSLSFENPRPFGLKYPTLVSLILQRLAEKSFRSDRYTAYIQLERKYNPNFIAYFTYYLERISIFDLNGPIEEIERNQRPIRLGRIGPSFLLDKRDNKFDPTTGHRSLGSFYIASSALGGNEQFVKLTLEHSRFYPVKIKNFRDTVYSISGRLGLAAPFGGNETLPISERFFAGGARDLRGFGFEEAGPQTTVIVDGVPKQFPLGGNGLLVIQNELRFPLYKVLEGTVFSDTGNVFRRVRDMKPGELTETLGLGLRVKTPIGPVRMDVGFLVWNKPEGLAGHRFHFTIGQTF
jgi:outer membrane protein insertion porin family